MTPQTRCLIIGAALVIGVVPPVFCATEEVVTAPIVVGNAAQAGLTNAPGPAQEVVPALRAVLDTFETSREAQRRLQQQRAASDQVRTTLLTMSEEVKQLGQHREKVAQQLEVMEHQQLDRLATLRKELEARLQEELVQARAQITAQLEQDYTRQLHEFESRQREAIEQSLDDDLRFKEREIQQLTQEIEIQTRELVERLSRLEADSGVAKSLEQATSEAIAKRKADLYVRRQQLQAQRDAILKQRRDEFTRKLQQQQQLERQRRIVLKEAGLRQAMAEVLQKTQAKETSPVEPLRQALEEIDRRESQLAQQQTTLKSRLDTVAAALTQTTHELETLEGQRKDSLVRLETAFERSGPGLSPEALKWFSQFVQQTPPEVAAELGLLQQRLVARTEQERQLKEQHRMLRERELALQVSHQVEEQYQRLQEDRRRESEERSRRAQDLVNRATQLRERGQFNKALELVAEAQALNPPPPVAGSIALLRDQIMSEKGEAVTQAQYSYVESIFSNAMQAFQRGDYEQAIKMFEQVVSQEEREGSSSSRSTPAGAPKPQPASLESLPPDT
ncbi:MAG: hypothetical protein HYZ92_00495 [Candidatus Omnitrophica bacterium]|nr:hypothetical protein [Candidatus Omnitrophota bacterium]